MRGLSLAFFIGVCLVALLLRGMENVRRLVLGCLAGIKASRLLVLVQPKTENFDQLTFFDHEDDLSRCQPPFR